MRDILLIEEKDKKTNIYLANGDLKVVNCKSIKFIENLCIICGSTLNGRISAFNKIINSKQKACIMVSENIIFIPTMSIKNVECQYIQYNRIVRVKSVGDKTMILFDNRTKKIIDCSYRTLQKQIKRCDLFVEKLLKNMTKNLEQIVNSELY